jgi:hypothetical protein
VQRATKSTTGPGINREHLEREASTNSATNMETDRSKNKFDRWRESCFAILENGSVVSCSDRSEWLEWMQETFSRGNHWIVEDEVEGFYILTEFLGINHNVTGIGPPLWFETFVFRSSADGMLGAKMEYGTVRYSTAAEALAGHLAICEKVKSGAIAGLTL